MYAKPTCPTPLKILLVVVIVVELAAIGLLLAGRAGASEGRGLGRRSFGVDDSGAN